MSEYHGIDPVKFGQMLAILQRLEPELTQARVEVRSLEQRIQAMEERYRIGKYGAFGILLVIGFALFGVKETLTGIWKITAG